MPCLSQHGWNRELTACVSEIWEGLVFQIQESQAASVGLMEGLILFLVLLDYCGRGKKALSAKCNDVLWLSL